MLEFVNLSLSLVALTIIVVITIILFVQYTRLKKHMESDFRTVISQVNDVNQMYLSVNDLQNNNIQSLNDNLNTLKAKMELDKSSAYFRDNQILVKKLTDGRVQVCDQNGSNCKIIY
jgi:hypothetical protein